MKLPKINLRELEKIKKQNIKERLEFHDKYVEWMKTRDNAVWSSSQKSIIDRKSKPSNRSSRNRSVAKKR